MPQFKVIAIWNDDNGNEISRREGVYCADTVDQAITQLREAYPYASTYYEEGRGVAISIGKRALKKLIGGKL